MIIEGEEETGSAGFQDAIKKHSVCPAAGSRCICYDLMRPHPGCDRRYRRDTRVQLVLDRRGCALFDFRSARRHPCYTRGVHAHLVSLWPSLIVIDSQISSNQPDMHSGMQGGTVHEPLIDMVRLLATLTDHDSKVVIPGFYDHVATMGDHEQSLLDEVIRREA